MGLADRTPPTAEEYAAYRERFSNWGRWGAEDRLGTLNHITTDVRRRAAGLVQTGRTVSLALHLNVPPRSSLPAGFNQTMRVGEASSGDQLDINFHGWSITHLDALCHIFSGPGGALYNGRPSADVTADGARSGDVAAYAGGLVTRGVLYDVPRFRGVSHVTLDTPVTIFYATGMGQVPNFRGLTREEAVQTAKNAGFTKLDFTEAESTLPVGQVFDQNPGAGSNVKRTTTLHLKLAKAAPTAPPTMPTCAAPHRCGVRRRCCGRRTRP